MDSPKKRNSDASNRIQGSPRISHSTKADTNAPTSAPGRLHKTGSRRVISIASLDGAVQPPFKKKLGDEGAEDGVSPGSANGGRPKLGRGHGSSRKHGLKDSKKHSSRRLSDHKHSSKIHLSEDAHWTDFPSTSRRSGTHDDDGERSGHSRSGHGRRRSSRKHSKSPSKSPSRRRSSRKLSKSPSRSPTRKRNSAKLSPSTSTSTSRSPTRKRNSRKFSKSPSRSPTRSNRGHGSSSRRNLLERSKSPSKSNRGSSRRDLLKGSKSPSRRGSKRDSLRERSKSPSRSNRGASRRDLLERSKSPSRSNRSSRRDLVDVSKSPSKRSSRRLLDGGSGSMRKTRTSNPSRPSFEVRDGLSLTLDEVPNLIEAKNSTDSSVGGLNRKKKLMTIIIIVLMLLLGISAGVAWFLLTQTDSDDSETDGVSGGDAPTTSSPSMQSAPPTAVPSSLPTNSPTNTPQLFDPPTQEDCLRIRSGLLVLDQENMIPTPFGLDFDVTVNPEFDTNFWTTSFMQEVRRNLVPDLTGCDRRQRRRDVMEVADDHHRQLNEVRYGIGNVNATGLLQLDKSCEDDAPQPCYRFVVKMDLYLKDVLSNFQLISLVVGIVNPPDSDQSLVARLGLPAAVFENVEVVLLGSTTESPTAKPSQTPSQSPSMVPSSIPSMVPSESPTPRPTPSPTFEPTIAPSRTPTDAPSDSPSPQPSSQPSGQPTTEPSLRPSSRPSSRPSLQPSSRPSSSPSNAPA